MHVKTIIDRKLILMVLAPVARAILSLIAGYLSAKGIPPDLIDQFAAAVGVLGVVGFNITWEVIDRKRAEIRGAKRVLTELKMPVVP